MLNISYKTLFYKILLIINSISLLLGSLVTVANSQKSGAVKGKAPAVAQIAKNTKPKACSGGWSGTITFKKTLVDSLESDEPLISKSIDRQKHKTSRNYEYTGRAIVDASVNPAQPTVKGTVDFTDNDLNWGEQKVWESCGSRDPGRWQIVTSNDDRVTQAKARGEAKSFHFAAYPDMGTYSFGVTFPDAQGAYKREEHVRRSGFCNARNNEPFDRSVNEPTKIDGTGFSLSDLKLDPENPDVISGTKVWGDDGSGAVRSFIYEATWYFTRCPVELIITELKFEHPKFPDFEKWAEIDEIKGTIDGNKVKVKAKVLNMGGETKYADLKIAETYKGDKYNYSRPDEPLPEAESSFRIEGGEEKEFEFIWDIEGQAWFDDGRPHLNHRIKAELREDGKKKDEKEKPLRIAPKPLILAHGAWSDYRVWEPLYQNLLTETHSYSWKAFAVGENAREGVMAMGNLGISNNIFDNADQMAKYVNYAQRETNAWHVDIVAHQMGGLVARAYAQKQPVSPDGRPLVKHLVMLGTPNGGAKCIDVFAGKFKMFEKELNIARELTNENMLIFNQHVKNTGGTKFSALAGNSVPVICGGYEWNDGFVTVKSALYGVSDVGQSNDLTHQLTNAKNFSNFVRPHLVTGPGKTYPYPVKNDPTDWKRWQLDNRDYDVNMGARLSNDLGDVFRNVSYQTQSVDPQTFVHEAPLAPRQSVMIDVPVETAQNFGISFMAAAGVSATLIDGNGKPVAKSASGTEIASITFRALLVNKAVAKGMWKLKLENNSDLEQKFAGFGWSGPAMPVEKAQVAE